MLNFRKAYLEDKREFDRVLKLSDCPSLEYNFTTFFLWQDQFNMEFAIADEILYIRAGKTKKSYLFPCGSGDVNKAIELLLENEPSFHSLSKSQKEYLEEKFPDRFVFEEIRDDGDYIYTTESLSTLTGKKLSSKRNHINKFISENPDWNYETITAGNIDEVKEMHKKWCEISGCEEKNGLDAETIAVKKALDNYFELELSGGVIRAKDKVVAFSIGDELSENTFLVHIEKAFSDIQGAYQIINREFVINNCKGYEYVNREDDAGDEGLRKAKLSYRPYKILEKYKAKEKRQ